MHQTLLAIEGGTPAFIDGPPNWPVADDAIFQSVDRALRSGQWGKYDGDLTEQLHQSLRSKFGLQHSLLCSSGTISVELALRGVGVKAGDEVILSAYDFPGNFRAIESAGATPVLVDVVADGWVIDSNQIAAAVSEKTSAVLVSHLHGQTADVATIARIAAAHQISVIEDVCQSPGATTGGTPVGTLGDVATFSFGGSKLLSAGRGGAILSDNPSIIQRAKIFAHRGNDAFPLSQIQAALLLPQLERLATYNEIRHRSAVRVAESVNALDGLHSLMDHDKDRSKAEPSDFKRSDFESSNFKRSNTDLPTASLGSYYKLPIAIEESFPVDREKFLAVLQPEGIAIDVGFRGFLKRSRRRCRSVGELNHSQFAAAQTIVLHHPILLGGDKQIDRLIDTIERCHKFCVDQ